VGAATLAASLPIPIEIAGPASADRVALGAGQRKEARPEKRRPSAHISVLWCLYY